MKLAKIILFILLGLAAIWVALWLVGIITSLIYVAVILVVLYLIGLVVWKLLSSSKTPEESFKETYKQLNSKSQNTSNEEKLAQANRKLEELKRQQRQ
jgi:4-amino-4-deoxy-L-arabinose transferase-like glycosyltransferase